VYGAREVFDASLPEDDPNNFYMEREWRLLRRLAFTSADVARIISQDRTRVGSPRQYPDLKRKIPHGLMATACKRGRSMTWCHLMVEATRTWDPRLPSPRWSGLHEGDTLLRLQDG